MISSAIIFELVVLLVVMVEAVVAVVVVVLAQDELACSNVVQRTEPSRKLKLEPNRTRPSEQTDRQADSHGQPGKASAKGSGSALLTTTQHKETHSSQSVSRSDWQAGRRTHRQTGSGAASASGTVGQTHIRRRANSKSNSETHSSALFCATAAAVPNRRTAAAQPQPCAGQSVCDEA